MNPRVAALCCAVMLGTAAMPTGANAQYIPGAPLFSRHGAIGSIAPQWGLLGGSAYGYPGRYRDPRWCPPRYMSRPVRSRGVNPNYHGGGFRCWTETHEPAPNWSGDGYCVPNDYD